MGIEKQDFFIFVSGSKQYKISKGGNVWIDYEKDLTKDSIVQKKMIFDSNIGLVNNTISLSVLGTKLGKKLQIQKYRRRKSSKSKIGFRQKWTMVTFLETNKPLNQEGI